MTWLSPYPFPENQTDPTLEKPTRQERKTPSGRCCAGLATIPAAKACRDAARVVKLRGAIQRLQADPKEVLERVFAEVEGYDDLVLVRDIPFFRIASTTSCPSSARRISPIIRPTASSASRSWRGLSTCSRSACKRRSADRAIASTIDQELNRAAWPCWWSGAYWHVDARVLKQGASTVTVQFSGAFRDNPASRRISIRCCAAPVNERGAGQARAGGGRRLHAALRRAWADCLRNRRGRHAAGADGRLYEQARARQDHRVREAHYWSRSRQSLWRKARPPARCSASCP